MGIYEFKGGESYKRKSLVSNKNGLVKKLIK